MKIAHLSDLHYCPEHLNEVDKCTAFAVDYAISTGVDCFAITGDVFDHQVPLHSPAVAAVLKQVRRMADHAAVIILQGTRSHDVPGSLDVFRTVGGCFPVCVVDRICQAILVKIDGAYRWAVSANWRGPDAADFGGDALAVFSCLPPINKASVAATAEGDAAQAAGDYVADLMTGWAASNEQANKAGIATVLLSHGTVNGCLTEQGVPMHGNDHEFSTGALFASKARAIMLGHIHQNQQWSSPDGNQAAAYPGSIGRLHFGEVTDKGSLIWTVEDGTASTEFIKTPAKRLLQIDCNGEPDMNALAQQAKDAEGAHVRIRYSVDEENKNSVHKDAIAALFKGAAACKIEGQINPVTRTRAAGITQKDSLQDKLRLWAETVGEDPQPLLNRLEQLLSGEYSDLVDTKDNKIKAA